MDEEETVVVVTTREALGRELAAAFRRRALAQGWKPRTVKRAEAQMNYWLGAMMALELVDAPIKLPRALALALSVGNDMSDLYPAALALDDLAVKKKGTS